MPLLLGICYLLHISYEVINVRKMKKTPKYVMHHVMYDVCHVCTRITTKSNKKFELMRESL